MSHVKVFDPTNALWSVGQWIPKKRTSRGGQEEESHPKHFLRTIREFLWYYNCPSSLVHVDK